MIEVLFGESACGGLKMAQNYGRGKYPPGGSIGVIGFSIYCFDFRLSIGDISEKVLGRKRQQVLERLYNIYPEFKGEPAMVEEILQRGKNDLQKIYEHICTGETIRIWYSNQPDELCGLYWFMNWLDQWKLQKDQVFCVALPDLEIDKDENILVNSGWGGVKVGDWGRYLNLQRAAPVEFYKFCAICWKRLQQENTPLRAIINGRLISVQETFYDEFILREIELEEEEFHETRLIGNILGKYELGISDAWVAQRIENMITAGLVIPVTEAASDSPIYHRKLKKGITNMSLNTIETIRTRYSCRSFSDRMPADEHLQMIAEAAAASPSGVNRQLWRIIVLKNKELIDELEVEGIKNLAALPDKGMYDRIMSRGGKLYYNAPCMIVVPIAKAEPAGAELFDCGIVAENIALAAASLGIDSLICGLTAFSFVGEKRDKFKNHLGFPKGYEIGIAVLLGYAANPGGKPHEPDLSKITVIE